MAAITYCVVFAFILISNTSLACGCSVIDTAKAEIGVEEKGNNKGKQVARYLRTTGLGPGYPWCAAFVNWVLLQNDRPTPQAKQAWSPAWFPANRTVLQRGAVEATQPQCGDVFGIYFSSKERIAHVGLIEEKSNGYFITVEGNTDGAGSRDGQGVYRKRRVVRNVYKVSRWQ
jgi:hypothetical protein